MVGYKVLCDAIVRLGSCLCKCNLVLAGCATGCILWFLVGSKTHNGSSWPFVDMTAGQLYDHVQSGSIGLLPIHFHFWFWV
ncbi:unnamed protein product [Lathyrus oleraceus]